jgi:hypothetical protein
MTRVLAIRLLPQMWKLELEVGRNMAVRIPGGSSCSPFSSERNTGKVLVLVALEM